ncbi:unnamed protein product [Brassica oleracea var. botrytis]
MLNLSRFHGASRLKCSILGSHSIPSLVHHLRWWYLMNMMSKYTPVARTLSLNVLRVCVVLENG